MARVTCRVGCLFAVLTVLASGDVPAAERVGGLGEIERLTIRGAETFPADVLRAALANDFDVLLASAPDAPLEPLLQLLAARLTDGYLKAGFADPQVRAAVDPATGRIVVEIEEGRRYRCGGVRVTASEDVAAADVVRVLTVRPPTRPLDSEDSKKKPKRQIGPITYEFKADQDPLTNEEFQRWRRGEWADFHADAAKTYEEAIRSALARQGYFYPTFRAEIRPDADEPTGQPNGGDEASLWILVDDEGPRATVGQVIVEGAQRHSPEEIEKYLGVRTGLPVDARAVADWQRRLRESACFVEHEVRVFPAIGKGAPSDLLIRVLEPPNGPRLGEELTETDRVLIKWADWLSHWAEDGEEDFVVSAEAPQGSMTFVSSPRDGFLLDVRVRNWSPDVPVAGYTIIAGQREARIVSWHRGVVARWSVRNVQRIQLVSVFRYEPDPDDETWHLHHHMNFGVTGGGDDGSESSNQSKWAMPLDFHPASAVALGREDGVEVSLENDRLTLRRRGGTFVVDSQTGRLVSFHIGAESGAWQARYTHQSGETPSLVADGSSDRWEMLYALRPGEFARRVAEMDRLTADFEPAIDPMRPVSDNAHFLLYELEALHRFADRIGPARAESPDPAKKARGKPSPLLRLLVQRGALEPLDRWWLERAEGDAQEADEFELPWPKDGNEIQIPGVNNALFGFGRVVARFVFNLHCQVVPRDSGPGQVGWNLGLLATGRAVQAIANLDRLRNDKDTGPLTCWYAARLFGFVNPIFGRPFAESGLTRLETESFRREVETLLPTDGRCYELLESICQAAGSLTEEDFERLAVSGQNAEELQQIRRLAALARGHASGTGREVVVALLAAAWESRWKAQCRDDLERLTAPADKTGSSEATVTLDSVLPDYRPGSGRKGDDAPSKTKDRFEHLSLDALLPSEKPKTAEQSPIQFQFGIP